MKCVLPISRLQLGIVFVALVVVAGTVPLSAAEPPATGSVSGTISVKGNPRKLPPVVRKGAKVSDGAVCAAHDIADESFVSGPNGGVANVFVFLRKAPAGFKAKPPASPKDVVVEMKGCRFVPHCSVLHVSQRLVLPNRDKVAHNAHYTPLMNSPYGILIHPNSNEQSIEFQVAEPLPMPLKCDIHPWMRAHVLPLEHAFAAVTDNKGRFKIDGLPPGEHCFYIWHERVGWLERKFSVEIKPDKTTDVILDYTTGRFDVADKKPIKLTKRALDLHQRSLVIDGHNDLPWAMRTKAGSSFDQADIAQPQPRFHTDIARLRKGGVGAQFWSAYAPAETRQQKRAARFVLEQIDLIHRMVRRYPETFELAKTVDDIERIHKQGKIASMIGVEGGHAIENSLALLRMYYRLGVRYMTLTHSDTLDWADSATDEQKFGGLTPFGEDVVRTMNELGMLVDISHVSVETMQDALRVSTAPIIASHSSAYAIAQHPRNVPDHVLRQMKKNGGVIMVNYFSGFVVPESAKRMAKMFDARRELRKKHPDDTDFNKALARWRREHPILPGSIHDVLDHIDHIVKVAGIDHVGLGSDFDGVSMLPSQLQDVSTYPYITQGLLDRGYSEPQIKKILGTNLLRALREAERVSRELKAKK